MNTLLAVVGVLVFGVLVVLAVRRAAKARATQQPGNSGGNQNGSDKK